MSELGQCCDGMISVSEFRVLRALIEMQKRDEPPTSDEEVTTFINERRFEGGYHPVRVGLKINGLVSRGFLCDTNRYKPTPAGLRHFHEKMQSRNEKDERYQYWCDEAPREEAVPALA